jgi:flagellin
MGFRINTNVAALTAHNYAMVNNRNLDGALARLSSGLRINKAADDASGMSIADSLRSQASGLGQAISNANDGINLVQTADGALDEYSKIINTIRTKTIQAASDGQNADSRKAIQADITRLLQSANSIAKTTQFNGQKLLDGTFTNKAFHIGAYAGETVGFSVGNTQVDSIGAISNVSNNTGNGNTVDGTATWDALAQVNFTSTSTGNVLKAKELTVNGFDIAASLNTLSPRRLQDAQSVANAITDATGLIAQGKTIDKGNGAIAGSTLSDTNYLKINGVQVQNVTFSASDANGVLARAINDISNQTGVTAAVVGGKLELTAADGRNIAVGVAGTAVTGTGLTDTTTNSTSTTLATLANTATAAVTIAQGALVINGVDMAGTYGDGTTVGSAGTAFQAALRNISGMEGSTVSTAGAIVMNVNDGQDLNVSGTASATYASDSTSNNGAVLNSSEKGVISIFSNEKVTIGGTDPASFGFDAGGFSPKDNGTSLNSINVLTRNSAEVGILITDSAIKQLDATRSDLGSVQNQLESTVRNISVTQVNVKSAESSIRDVDFAKESANFAKFNILAQSGSYAMSQANIVQKNVLRLLQ